MFAFVNVYKPKGFTSFDVVARLRKIVNVRQIGHTGTLDPFAVGVLPICIGKATKLIEYLPDDKEYIATIQFGANTDTYDLEGNVTETFSKKVEYEDIVENLKNFEGEIEQLPPIYSAIKVNGKKLYDYARQGEEVEIKARKVNISKIELLDFQQDKQIAKIAVACSKGTYIRSIAYDLGKNLGCGGYLIELERTKAGMFNIEHSIKLENLTTENIREYLINPVEVFSTQAYPLNEKEKDDVIHGRSFIPAEIPTQPIVFFTYSDKMYGVGEFSKNKIIVKKVFETV